MSSDLEANRKKYNYYKKIIYLENNKNTNNKDDTKETFCFIRIISIIFIILITSSGTILIVNDYLTSSYLYDVQHYRIKTYTLRFLDENNKTDREYNDVIYKKRNNEVLIFSKYTLPLFRNDKTAIYITSKDCLILEFKDSFKKKSYYKNGIYIDKDGKDFNNDRQYKK